MGLTLAPVNKLSRRTSPPIAWRTRRRSLSHNLRRLSGSLDSTSPEAIGSERHGGPLGIGPLAVVGGRPPLILLPDLGPDSARPGAVPIGDPLEGAEWQSKSRAIS